MRQRPGLFITYHSLPITAQLLLVLVNIVVRVAHTLDFLGVFIGDLNAKLFFKTHDEFHCIQRIGAQVIDEAGVGGDFILVHTKFVDDNLFYFILDLLIGHLVLLLCDFCENSQSALATPRSAPVDFRLSESSTLRLFTSRLIWRSSPLKTFPGPTSTKVSTP